MNNNLEKLRLARQWAKRANEEVASGRFIDKTARSAAEVILSLPDVIVDGAEVREWMDGFIQRGRRGTPHEWLADAFTELQNKFLTPKPRTLADMTPEERKGCQWRMVDTPEGEGVYLKQHMDIVAVIYPSGRHIFWGMEEVVPLLDRPRMVWPAAEPVTESSEGNYQGILDSSGSGQDAPTLETRPAETSDNPSSEHGADLAEDGWSTVSKTENVATDQPRTVQDLVHHFEERAKSAWDGYVADVWQKAADTVWAALGGEPAPLPKPEDCKPDETWLIREGNGSPFISRRDLPSTGPGYTWTGWHGGTAIQRSRDSQVTLLARLTPDRSVEK